MFTIMQLPMRANSNRIIPIGTIIARGGVPCFAAVEFRTVIVAEAAQYVHLPQPDAPEHSHSCHVISCH